VERLPHLPRFRASELLRPFLLHHPHCPMCQRDRHLIGALIHAPGSAAPILESAFPLRDTLTVCLVCWIVILAGVGAGLPASVFPVR
jgi:hypothetical protein